MKPSGIGRFKPPAPVYRACTLCGKKHRVRPDGTSKTGEILAEQTEVLVWDGPDPYLKVPAGAFVCRPHGSLSGRLRCRAPSHALKAAR